MTSNYFKMLKGVFIQNYLNYYLVLEDINVEEFDSGYKN